MMKILYWKNKETGIIKHGDPISDDNAPTALGGTSK